MTEAPARSWLTPKAEVRPSQIEGRGLFAREPIHADEAIIIMGGQVLSEAEFRALDLEKYSAAQIGEDTHILLDTPTDADYGNHSCDANTWMRDAVTTEARRDIDGGEELTIDYATHTADAQWSMTCHCGADACRRVVRGDDWRRRDVQQRYKDHFSPFLNERIAALESGGVL